MRWDVVSGLGLDSSFVTHRLLCDGTVDWSTEQLMSLSSILARAMMEGVVLLFLVIAMLIAPRRLEISSDAALLQSSTFPFWLWLQQKITPILDCL